MIKTAQLISTAIMKTDIIGFSSIVGELSDFELSQLLEDHKKFIIKIIYKYDGSIIKGEGDAFFISFSSVTAAIESAVEIQSRLKRLRENSDAKFRLSLKIIISLGDVLHKNNDVYGDSVNIISRIEISDLVGIILIVISIFLVLRRIRIRIIQRFNKLSDCPECGEDLNRKRRTTNQRILSWILYMKMTNYSCSKCNYHGIHFSS